VSATAGSPFNAPVPVSFDAPVVSGGQSPITTTCTPPSGSSFPVGSNGVTCVALDALQRSVSCTFMVTVTPAPQISLTQFVSFGDSITWGEDGTNATLTGYQPIRLIGSEYPSDLTTLLRGRYQLQAGVINVVNNGLPGEYASDPTDPLSAVRRFTATIPSRGYQAVLIMEGSNDVNEAARSGSSFEDAALVNLRSMIRIAKGAGVRPYLASLPPMNASSCSPQCRGRGAALVPEFNARLNAVASSEGVTFVDVNAAFGGDLSLLSTDGLHPNASGYERIAEAFFTVLKQTLDLTPALTASPAMLSRRLR